MGDDWTAGGLSSFLEDISDDAMYDGERMERYMEIIAISLAGIFRQLEIINEGNDENKQIFLG